MSYSIERVSNVIYLVNLFGKINTYIHIRNIKVNKKHIFLSHLQFKINYVKKNIAI